jgi:chemotaxis protein MotB
MMSRYIEQDLIAVRRDRLWLEIDIKTRLLFESGSARPAQSARPVLQQLADYFSLVPNAIQVEGYTDDDPISTPLFPSNWELSSARAAAVVRLMVAFGVQPDRMSSVGYAEFRPIADNSSADGRQRNRRVVIKLMADLQPGDPAWQRSVQNLQTGKPRGRNP